MVGTLTVLLLLLLARKPPPTTHPHPSHRIQGIKYMENADEDCEESDEPVVKEISLALESNLAACQLKLKDARAAAATCQKILDLDADNVKALFRLGQANNLLGDFVAAVRYLNMANQLAPNDLAIQRELQLVKANERKLLEKEKQMFGKMFA